MIAVAVVALVAGLAAASPGSARVTISQPHVWVFDFSAKRLGKIVVCSRGSRAAIAGKLSGYAAGQTIVVRLSRTAAALTAGKGRTVARTTANAKGQAVVKAAVTIAGGIPVGQLAISLTAPAPSNRQPDPDADTSADTQTAEPPSDPISDVQDMVPITPSSGGGRPPGASAVCP